MTNIDEDFLRTWAFQLDTESCKGKTKHCDSCLHLYVNFSLLLLCLFWFGWLVCVSFKCNKCRMIDISSSPMLKRKMKQQQQTNVHLLFNHKIMTKTSIPGLGVILVYGIPPAVLCSCPVSPIPIPSWDGSIPLKTKKYHNVSLQS